MPGVYATLIPFLSFPWTGTSNNPYSAALYVAAKCIKAAYAHSLAGVQAAATPWAPLQVVEHVWGPAPEDSFYIIDAPPDLIFVDSGTETIATLVDTIWHSQPTDILTDDVDAALNFFWTRGGQIATSLAPKITTMLAARPAGTYTNAVFIGHSLGAAEGLCLAKRVAGNFTTELPNRLLVSFGQPRVFSPHAADNFPLPHIRVFNNGDIVTHLPPAVQVVAFGGPLGVLPIIVPPRFWKHHGQGVLLAPDGKLWFTNVDVELDDAFAEQTIGGFLALLPSWRQAHKIDEYIIRLTPRDPAADVPPQGLSFITPSQAGGLQVLAQTTLFFETVGLGIGWSETFYSTVSSLDNALTDGIALADKRAAMLGKFDAQDGAGLSRINQVRVSDVDILGDSLIKTRDDRGNLWDGALGSSDYPSTALLVRLMSGAKVRRMHMLSGIPDALCTQGGKFVSRPDFAAAFAAWFAYLKKAPPYLIRSIDKDPALTKKITNIVLAPGPDPVAGTPIITTAGAHGLNDNDRVRIRGVKWHDPDTGTTIKGLYTVAVVSTTSFSLKHTVVAGDYDRGGSMTKQQYNYVPIDGYVIERMATRRRGRVFGLPRGQRRVR